MRTSTEDRVRSCSSRAMEPDHLAKRPCTLEMTMWRTQKWMAEWLTSTSQVLVAMSVSFQAGRLGPATRPVLPSFQGRSNV